MKYIILILSICILFGTQVFAKKLRLEPETEQKNINPFNPFEGSLQEKAPQNNGNPTTYDLKVTNVEAVQKALQSSIITSLTLENLTNDQLNQLLPFMKTLISLRISNADLSTSIQGIAKLSNLKSLSLSATFMDDHAAIEGVRHICQMRNLTSLELIENRIGNAAAQALRQMTQLIYLNLRYNKIGKDGVKAIALLYNLKFLDLYNNWIDNDGVEEFPQMKKLIYLNLGRNRLSNTAAKILAKLKNLMYLDLSDNSIGDEGIKAIAARMKKLISLNLRSNRIEKEGVKAVATMLSLKYLNLSNHQINDEEAKLIASMKSLVSLDLHHNRIGDTGGKALAAMLNLISLDLHDNRISYETLMYIARTIPRLVYFQFYNQGTTPFSPEQLHSIGDILSQKPKNTEMLTTLFPSLSTELPIH